MSEYSDNLTVADVEAVLLSLPDHEITGDEMCPCQNRRPAPDAVARLVEAATVLGPWISASLSDPHTHAGEDYTRDADAFLVALAAMEASDDRT